MRALAMNCSSSGNFIFAALLSKIPVHEFPIQTPQPGDAVEYSSPKIEIVPLENDPVVIAESKLRASVKRGAGKFLKLHHHLPLKKTS